MAISETTLKKSESPEEGGGVDPSSAGPFSLKRGKGKRQPVSSDAGEGVLQEKRSYEGEESSMNSSKKKRGGNKMKEVLVKRWYSKEKHSRRKLLAKGVNLGYKEGLLLHTLVRPSRRLRAIGGKENFFLLRLSGIYSFGRGAWRNAGCTSCRLEK